jgi:plastocyanin
MRHRVLVVSSVAAALVIALVAVAVLLMGGHPAAKAVKRAAAPAIRSGAVAVAIGNYDFLPKRHTVTVRTRVTWTNNDATPHTATADGSGFDTGTIQPKASRTIDFTRPGIYTYHCAFHAFMTATITVKG